VVRWGTWQDTGAPRMCTAADIGIMITDSMLLSAQINDPCRGVIVDCVRYVLAKGHVILSSDQPRNMIAIWR
jgi:hypothetical protein